MDYSLFANSHLSLPGDMVIRQTPIMETAMVIVHSSLILARDMSSVEAVQYHTNFADGLETTPLHLVKVVK